MCSANPSVPGLYKKHTEQAMGSKSVSSTFPWPLLRSCPDITPRWTEMRTWKADEPPPPQADFGHGLYHCTGTLCLLTQLCLLAFQTRDLTCIEFVCVAPMSFVFIDFFT